MSMRNQPWIVLLLAFLILMAGCSGVGGGSDDAPQLQAEDEEDFERKTVVAERTPMATGEPIADQASESVDGGTGGAVEAEKFAERQLILRGQVEIEVQDFEAARRNLTQATETYGGFVSDTRQEVNRIDNQTWTDGELVLRVPHNNFTTLYERARTEGELIEAQQNSQDVTDQLVDIQARLENLRAERNQLRTLYERANQTEDVLKVQERLSEVQGEIERLKARQKSLRQRVALSTITVRLREPRPEPVRPGPDNWYDIALLAAFLESVNGVVVTGRAIAVGIAYAVPYVFAFGLPLGALGYLIHRRHDSGSGRLRRLLNNGGNDDATSSSPSKTKETDSESEQDAPTNESTE